MELGDETGINKVQAVAQAPADGGKWSGEQTRGIGLRPENQDITIDIGNESEKAKDVPKDVPIWITQSTVEGTENLGNYGEVGNNVGNFDDPFKMETNTKSTDDDDEITKLLLQHEKKNSASAQAASSLNAQESDSSDNENNSDNMEDVQDKVETMNSSDDDAEDGIPTVRVGHEEITITDVNEDIINRMTAEEKERYTQIFQEFYAHMYD